MSEKSNPAPANGSQRQNGFFENLAWPKNAGPEVPKGDYRDVDARRAANKGRIGFLADFF